MRLPYTPNSVAISGYSTSRIARSEKSDCVVRAIASSSGLSYDNAHRYVSNKFKRKDRKRTANFDNIMNSIGYLNCKTVRPIELPERITVGAFANKYNVGTFILKVVGHAFTIKNGVIIGNPEDAYRVKRIVLSAWKIGMK